MAGEFDDLLIEWKISELPTKSQFEGAVAAIEHVIPQFKGELKWAKTVIHSCGVIGVSLRLSNLNASMAYAIKHALTFFVGAEVFLAQLVQVVAAPCASDHASGRLEDGGSVLLSTFAGLDGCEVSVGVREIENFEVEYSPVEVEGHGGRGRARGGGTAHEVVRGSGRGRGSQ